MKILFILSVVFLASAQANFFTDLANAFKTIFQTLGNAVSHELDTTGVSLLNAGVAAGKTLVSQGIQALALNTANALKNVNTPTQPTRDVSLLQQLETELHNVLDRIGAALKVSFAKLESGLEDIVEKASKLDITPEEVISEVDKLVSSHNVIADGVLKLVESKVGEVVTALVPRAKRNAFTDFFAGVGKSLASLFKPVVDGVKTLATSAGSTVKNGTLGLLAAAKQSVQQLGEKLKPHLQALGTNVGNLVQQGSNALGALKAAGKDVLQQTLENVKEPLNNITGVIKDAGKTVVSHVAGTLLGGLPVAP